MSELPTPPARPQRARRGGRPATLDRAAVVDAALRVLDAEGLDAVTIRGVAAELGASPTAIYTYVRDKEELVELLVDRVIGEIPVSVVDPEAPWQEQVRAFARAFRRTAAAHRDIARATLGRVPQGENALTLMNAMLGVLRGAGLPDDVISYGSDLLTLYVGAYAYEESLMATDGLRDQADVERWVAELRRYFTSLPADRFPHMVVLADALTRYEGPDSRFEFGLDVIIAGLGAVAERR